MSVELTFNASDNDVAPDGPVFFQMECDSMIINQSYSIIISIHKSKWVSDELTFNASDNDDAPGSPILFKMECDSMIINQS